MVEDSVHGRYASVLFTSASKEESLHLILKDLKFFKELSKTVS